MPRPRNEDEGVWESAYKVFLPFTPGLWAVIGAAVVGMCILEMFLLCAPCTCHTAASSHAHAACADAHTYVPYAGATHGLRG